MHPECHYKCPCKRKTEGDFTDKGEESNVITDADAAQLALRMRERDHESKNTGGL